MPGRAEVSMLTGMDNQPVSAPTPAFFLQAVASFALSLGAVAIAIAFLPADGWVRAFLAVAVLYLTTSAFTLAKTIRDRQESSSVLGRVDQARLEQFLAGQDPYRPVG